jgi:hypothetical protein
MEEEQSNTIIADDFLKLANNLDPNSSSEFIIEWLILKEQNGGVEQCLNVVKLC